jgi:hypothetical protein
LTCGCGRRCSRAIWPKSRAPGGCRRRRRGRIGSWKQLLHTYEWCAERGIISYGGGQSELERQWTWGPAALVLGRAIRPGWELLSRARLSQWLAWLPANDPLERELAWLRDRVGRIEWESAEGRCRGHLLGLRIMLRHGYTSPREITDADLRAVPDRVYRGMDALDAALCEAGVLRRSPQRGSQRRLRRRRLTPAELVAGSQPRLTSASISERSLEVLERQGVRRPARSRGGLRHAAPAPGPLRRDARDRGRGAHPPRALVVPLPAIVKLELLARPPRGTRALVGLRRPPA